MSKNKGEGRIIVRIPEFDDDHRRKLDWMDRAHCRNNPIPPEEFFPVGKTGDVHARHVKRIIAKSCGNCEVKLDCLLYAQRIGATEGIWGGIDLINTKRYDLNRLFREAQERA